MEAFGMLKVAFGVQTVAKTPIGWFIEFRIHVTTVEDDNIVHWEYNIILVSHEIKLFIVSPLTLHSLLTLH